MSDDRPVVHAKSGVPFESLEQVDTFIRRSAARQLRKVGLVRDAHDLKKRYTIVVPPDLHKEIKTAAAESEMTMQVLTEEILWTWIKKLRTKQA